MSKGVGAKLRDDGFNKPSSCFPQVLGESVEGFGLHGTKPRFTKPARPRRYFVSFCELGSEAGMVAGKAGGSALALVGPATIMIGMAGA